MLVFLVALPQIILFHILSKARVIWHRCILNDVLIPNHILLAKFQVAFVETFSMSFLEIFITSLLSKLMNCIFRIQNNSVTSLKRELHCLDRCNFSFFMNILIDSPMVTLYSFVRLKTFSLSI